VTGDIDMMRETEVDGVATLIAPTSGPMHAGLVFRVGTADETLARAGVTHLVEHLALYRHGLTDYHYNGGTATTATHFHMQGSEEDVVAFLTGVCDSLNDLPAERLETEKAVLRTEWSSRTPAVNEPLPLWRYGARDFGLISYPEWGVSRLTADEMRWWAQTWFTRENAVLWIAGNGVPAGLRLRLPSGVRRPVPVPSSALPITPAYFASGNKAVVLDAVVRRRVAASVYSGVLERELFRSLRQEGGYSYTATTSYDTRSDGFAIVTALADALPEKRAAALGGFIDVLAKLRVGRVEQPDVDAVLAKAMESLKHPELAAARLPGCAVNLLTGQPNKTVEEMRSDLRATTAGEVHQVAVEAMSTALLMVPQGLRADWAGFTAAPDQSPGAVPGNRFLSREEDGTSLVIGAEGVSLVVAAGARTVRFADCAVALAWPDGARQLIGYDAISLGIEPTLFTAQPADLAAIDGGLDPAVVVPMPARRPEAIPQPAAPAAAAAPAKGGRFETAALVMLMVLLTLVACTGLLCTAAVGTDSTSGGGEWGVVAAGWVFALLLAVPTILMWRQRRARRRSARP
jgi:predicted Zn-dependent peptidase